MPCDLFIMDRRRSVVRRVNYGQKGMLKRVRVQMHDFNMECIGTMGVRGKCSTQNHALWSLLFIYIICIYKNYEHMMQMFWSIGTYVEHKSSFIHHTSYIILHNLCGINIKFILSFC